MNKQQIKSDDPSYFAMIPHLATDTMNPYQLALYTHYKRVAKENGSCFEGVRTTAKKTQMSVGKVVSTRDELARDGWIKVQYPDKDNDPKATIIIEVNSKWPENREYGESLKKCSYSEQSVHTVNTSIEPTVHVVNERIIVEEKKNIKDSASAALGDSASKNGHHKNGKEPEAKRDYIFDLVAILFFGFRDMSLFDNLNEKSKKNMSGRIAKISSWLRDLYKWDEPVRTVFPSEKVQEIKRDCQQFCKWYAVQYKNAARPKDIEKFAVNYMDWIKEKTPELHEPDKDCPKCRGLGYWIDKTNANNHQSIDCECRSKQRVKS